MTVATPKLSPSPAAASSSTATQSDPEARVPGWNWAAFRAVLGLVFVMHGGQKLFVFGIGGAAGFFEQLGIPFPYLSAIAVTATEILGGAALLVGFFSRLVAVPLAATMLVAGLTAHRSSFFLPDGFEYVLVLFAGLIAVVQLGSGPGSVDRWLAKRSS